MTRLVRLIGTRSFRWRLLYLIREGFQLLGRGWNDFYAWMLDFQDRELTLERILSRPRNMEKFKGLWDWWRGEYHWDYMKRYGLTGDKTILDIGCGYGRTAIPILREQTGNGHYIGTEISKVRLRIAYEWIESEKLDGKNFTLVCSKDNALPFISDGSVDAAWVMSVFNHMPDKELKQLLFAIHRSLKEDGMLFCYYVVPELGRPETVKTFRRSDASMDSILNQCGFMSSLMSDWDDDLGDRRTTQSRMRICRKTVLEPFASSL